MTMIRINQIRLTPVKNEKEDELKNRVLKKISHILRMSEKDILRLELVKSSIDARKKPEVFLTVCADVSFKNEDRILSKNKSADISKAEPACYVPAAAVASGVKNGARSHRPVVIGFGPAGMFAAYILALNGCAPLVLERGHDVDKRVDDVELFWKTGKQDERSNVQFGEGGAGTFSDGKLNTGIKDPSGRIAFVLKTFVEMGAPGNILYEQHPHIGTDILRSVVKNLRNEIIRLGGEIRFEACLTGLEIKDGQLSGVLTNGDELTETDCCILAPGHSARDTFKMLKTAGIPMESKNFAVGYRVIHPQDAINLAQYGEKYKDFFGAAPYKLSAKAPDGRGIYSFCMCPGGYVVNASSIRERLCVNGMSYSGRNGKNANSAIIMSVTAEDFLSSLIKTGSPEGACTSSDPLIGMYFQDLLEKRAWECCEGKIPVQYLEDYSAQKPSGSVNISEGIRGLFAPANLRGILPAALESAFEYAMPYFGRKIAGFDAPDTVIAGLESRTSSPVRIMRDETGQSAIRGLYPCGEGAGYAGGITSAAVDGIRVAENVLKGIPHPSGFA